VLVRAPLAGGLAANEILNQSMFDAPDPIMCLHYSSRICSNMAIAPLISGYLSVLYLDHPFYGSPHIYNQLVIPHRWLIMVAASDAPFSPVFLCRCSHWCNKIFAIFIIFYPCNLWVRGSNITTSSQPAKLPLFAGYSLENLTEITTSSLAVALF